MMITHALPRSRRLRCLALVPLFGLTACGFGSISPVIADSDVRTEPRLVGTWHDSANKETIVISADGPTAYLVRFTDSDQKTAEFHARFGVIGAMRALDVQPVDLSREMGDTYASLILRLHAPVIIDSAGTVLAFRLVETDSVKAFLRRSPQAVAHTMIDDGVVLTAPTAEVQRFLADFMRRPGVLSEPNVAFRRR